LANFLYGQSVRAAQYMKVKLNDLEIGAKWFGEYAQLDSDKTAKTRFRQF
jgi:hypothetical protein